MSNDSTIRHAVREREPVLSAAWTFLVANYIFCDLLSNMEPSTVRELLAGQLGGIQVTTGFLLATAVMMEIPFAMILLSRLLPRRVNRWANITAGAVMVLIQVGTLGVGTAPTPHYLFFSAVEIVGSLFIVWYAWTWARPASRPTGPAAHPGARLAGRVADPMGG